MLLLPFERFEIETPLSPIEVKKRIESILVPTRSFTKFFMDSINNMFQKSGSDQFNGKVDDQGFQLTRVIYYRNSFVPVLKGKLEERSNGTKITVLMTLHGGTRIFMLFWFIGVAAMAVISGSIIFSQGFDIFLLIPVVMLLFAWLLTKFSFVFEARKAKKILSQLFARNEVAIQKFQ